MQVIFTLVIICGLTNGQIIFPGDVRTTSGSQCVINGQQVGCKPLIQCVMYFSDKPPTPNDLCTTPTGETGFCCEDNTYNQAAASRPGGQPLPPPQVSTSIRVDLGQEDIETAARFGQGEVQRQTNVEDRLLRENQVVLQGTASFGHLQFFKIKPEAATLGQEALEVIEATRGLQNQFSLSATESGFGLTRIDVRQSNVLRPNCPPNPRCQDSKYRTADGSCNNLQVPKFGQAFTPFQRIIEPKYDDGIFSPREISVDGRTPLPGARIISEAVIPDDDNPDQDHTLLVMQMGQFLDHDLTHSPIFRLSNSERSGIECCTPNGDFVGHDLRHPQCYPIEIPQFRNDSFYRKSGRKCMNFVRSVPAPRLDCSFGYGEQMNQLTHWLDGSNVYGSTDEETEELRLKRGGKLRFFRHRNRDLLPLDPEDEDCSSLNDFCFKAGDSRVNEQIDLVVMHTVWMREHNRVAGLLQTMNPSLSDEEIFQEARRIVIAEMQHITYNEWLPIILGKQYMKVFNLLPLSKGYSQDYNNRINPQITNEFATAGFRLGHTLIQGIIKLFSSNRHSRRQLALRHVFNTPRELQQPGVLDELLRGLATQRMQTFDNLVSAEVTEHLFEPPGMDGHGMDLVAFNIHRGRDHGLSNYNDYREICGQRRARDFNDLGFVTSRKVIDILKQHYNHVDDIDLYVGGVLERPIAGAILGQTFLCIVGDQFARLKKADRYFYDLGNQRHSFTEVQLQEIRKASIARILCDNGDAISFMQPLAFRAPNNGFNKIVSCDSSAIPRVNIQYWRKQRRG